MTDDDPSVYDEAFGWQPGTAATELGNKPTAAGTAPARRTSWTATELLAASFPPPRWAVEGLIAEGLTLFVGAPKVGKSWAAVNLGVAVATGGKAFGKVDVEAGDVLYLALEDTPRRLQSRLRKVLAGSPPCDRLTISTECETITNGGSQRITGWLDKHPDARLVIVDVFARIRGRAAQQSSAYEADYAPMAALKAIADTYGVAVLVIHHTRKAGAEDFMDQVSGTQGLNGAADATMVLKRSRGSADAVLQVTGRDIDEAEYALTFAADIAAWQMLDGPAGDYTLSDTRRQILQHLRQYDGATPKQVADSLGMEHNTVKQRLWQMAKSGEVDTDGHGQYMPVTAVTAVTVGAPTHPPHNPVTGEGYDGYEGYEGQR